MAANDPSPPAFIAGPDSAATPLLADSEGPAEENNGNNETVHAPRSWLSLVCAPLTDETGNVKSVVTGLSTIFLVGGLVGALIVPHDKELEVAWYRVFSAAIGYIYFLAWSLSFYPQVLTNWRRKTTQGLSVDFCLLNVLGFACYTAYTVALYASPVMRREYRARQHSAGIPVESNDVAFCVHALILSSVTVGQIVWYNASVTALFTQVTPVIRRFILFLLFWIVILGPALVWTGVWHGLDYLYSLSFVKVMISLIKYMPQVWLNIQRQSTVGWSIWQILLDLTGGLLSNVQMVGDTWSKTHPGASVVQAIFTGNPAKLALGTLSMAFDIVFMVQHYILYPVTSNDDNNNNENEVLIDPDQDDNGDEDDNGDDAASTQALNGACPADQCRMEQA